MVKAVTAYNNFARGKVDHDMMGRFDLPIYRSASDVFDNFISNFKGNAIYRTGFEDMVGEFQDCVLHEFLFRIDQNYIMVFYNTKVRFLTYDSGGVFGWVESSPSVILEVTTPYSLADCRELQFTQNGDVTVITHNDHAPQDLTRVSATSFTIGAHAFTGTPPFTTPNWPASCLFYKNRLYFANIPTETTTFWGSETGDFAEFTIGAVTDISPLKFTISDIIQPIDWLFGGENSLILGCADGLVTINGGGVGIAITASTIEANLSTADGSSVTIPLSKDGLTFYVGKNERNVYYFSFDLLSESFLAQDANVISYDITKGGSGKIRHKKDRDDLIFNVRGDGDLLSLNFNQAENIIGWHVHKTNGLFKDIAVITNNEGDPQLFSLVDRDGAFFIERQAAQVSFSERSSFFSWDRVETKKVAEARDEEAYARKVSQELTDCIYLDNSLTINNLQEGNTISYTHDSGWGSGFGSGFGIGALGGGTMSAASPVFSAGDVGKHISYKTDTGYESGRFIITSYVDASNIFVEVLQAPTQDTWDDWYLSFDNIAGLTQYIGQTIGVVTDGGFLDFFEIDSDTLDFETEVLTVVVGYPYTGLIKSFSLGFQIQAENTQTTLKNINKVSLRAVASAGGMVGSSPYKLQPFQELKQGDLNYLPPLPIDGTEDITYVDNAEEDKYFYLVQDTPLPLTITSVFIDAKYSISR